MLVNRLLLIICMVVPGVVSSTLDTAWRLLQMRTFPQRLFACGLTSLKGKKNLPIPTKTVLCRMAVGPANIPQVVSFGGTNEVIRTHYECCSYHCDMQNTQGVTHQAMAKRSRRINSYSKLGSRKHNSVQGENKSYSCVQNTSRMRNTLVAYVGKLKELRNKGKKRRWHYPTAKKIEITVPRRKSKLLF